MKARGLYIRKVVRKEGAGRRDEARVKGNGREGTYLPLAHQQKGVKDGRIPCQG